MIFSDIVEMEHIQRPGYTVLCFTECSVMCLLKCRRWSLLSDSFQNLQHLIWRVSALFHSILARAVHSASSCFALMKDMRQGYLSSLLIRFLFILHASTYTNHVLYDSSSM